MHTMKKRLLVISIGVSVIFTLGYGVNLLTVTPLLSNTPTTMEPTILILKNGETKTVSGLTITNLENDRGHKIMADGGGDNSFASLRLESEGVETQELRIHNPILGETTIPIVYGSYSIVVQKVQWDGEHVELLITSE